MEKRLYDLDENGPFSTVLPPLTEMEETYLRQSLEAEGCRESLIVWNGVIVDGHNRYRICKELGIPFGIQSIEFESEAEARVWLIKNQLGRRNVAPFAKIETVYADSVALRAAFRSNQGRRRIENLANLPKISDEKYSRDILAESAGVSSRTFGTGIWLIEHADTATKKLLREGELSIYKAKEMTEWHLETADEFTRYRIQKGVITLEKAYEEYKKREKEELERLKTQAEQDSHEDQEDEEWNEEGDYDPTFGGKVVPLFPTRSAATPSTGQRAPLVAGGYIGGFTQNSRAQNNQAQKNACQPKKKGEIVSIIPYLKARGWKPDNNACDDDSGDECNDSNAPKGEIISIIPFLKARGRLPMDYEEPDGDADDDYGEEEYDSEEYGGEQYDGDDEIEGEDDADEPVAHKQRVVNIADIKVCDPAMPISKGGVSLMGAYVGEDHGNGCRHDGCYEDDAMKLIRAEGGNTSTITFEMILTTMERVSHDFEDNMAVLLSAVASEDRTVENGIRVNNILNDCMTAVINNYTEVF